MTLYHFEESAPTLPGSGNVYVAPGAQLIGAVTLSDWSSVWFNAVLRADNEPIVLGRGSNIQDGCICHTDPGFPLTIGEDVTVGHGAILHGCTVGDGSLIGMGAIVLNGAKIGKGCIIGANALVTEGKEIPDGSMVLGSPGKVVKTFDAEAMEKVRRSADVYKDKVTRYLNGLSTA